MVSAKGRASTTKSSTDAPGGSAAAAAAKRSMAVTSGATIATYCASAATASCGVGNAGGGAPAWLAVHERRISTKVAAAQVPARQ